MWIGLFIAPFMVFAAIVVEVSAMMHGSKNTEGAPKPILIIAGQMICTALSLWIFW